MGLLTAWPMPLLSLSVGQQTASLASLVNGGFVSLASWSGHDPKILFDRPVPIDSTLGSRFEHRRAALSAQVSKKGYFYD